MLGKKADRHDLQRCRISDHPNPEPAIARRLTASEDVAVAPQGMNAVWNSCSKLGRMDDLLKTALTCVAKGNVVQ